MTTPADTMPAAHFQSQEALERDYWWHINRRKIALAWIRKLGVDRPRLLDLGCGTGGFLQQLAAQTSSPCAVGLDASPTALSMARLLGLDIRQADLSRPVKLEDPAFDVATAMDVLEHLPDEQALLQTAILNLRPGGYFIASVPAYQFLFSSWDTHLGHYRRYTRTRLLTAIRASGLQVMRCTYAFGYALPPALVRRVIGSAYSEDSCVFPRLPAFVNSTLRGLGSLEATILRGVSLPFGLSVFVLAQRA